MSQRAAGPHSSDPLQPETGTYALAAVVVLLTLGFALVWSHYKLFWVDELLEFYSDTRPSAAAVLFGQLHYPFSLEPPGFHLLLHFMDRLFPSHAELGSRLVSMLSLAVTEICVFRITLRLTAHGNTALVAMALPFLLVSFDYAPEARVYSLFAALFAVALDCYQSAIEEDGPRSLALWGLYVSLSGALLLHYSGIFLPLPILAGEAIRTLRRQRVDWLLLLALAAAFAMFAFNVPFLKPLHELQAHYLNGGVAHASMIPFTYLWFVFHFNPYRYLPLWGYRIETLCYRITWLCVVAFALSVCAMLWRSKRGSRGLPVVVAALAGFLLPFVNVVVAHYVTHAYAPRYSLPAVVSVCILAALLLDRPLRRPAVFGIAFALVVAVSSVYALQQIRRDRVQRQFSRAELVVTPALLAELNAQPDHHIYVQDVPRFLAGQFYLPQPFAPSIVGTGSTQRELFWLYRNTSSLYLRNIGLSTKLPVVAYESVMRTPGPHLFVIYNDPEEDWVGRELACRGLLGEPLGHALRGTLYRVSVADDGAGGSIETCTTPLRR